MIFVALGANLPHHVYGGPRSVLEEALRRLDAAGLHVLRRSRWYRSPPWPPSDQPWYVNGVAEVESASAPQEVLTCLHALEADFGRRRRERNAARVLDLDLIDWHGRVIAEPVGPVLPHPRMQERAFVLRPLAELAPDWRHPVTEQPIADLLAALPADAVAEPIEDEVAART